MVSRESMCTWEARNLQGQVYPRENAVKGPDSCLLKSRCQTLIIMGYKSSQFVFGKTKQNKTKTFYVIFPKDSVVLC